MKQALDRGSARWTTLAAVAAVLPLALTLPGSTQLLLATSFTLGALSAWTARPLPLPRALRAVLTVLALLAVAWLFDIGMGLRSLGRDAGSALLAVMLGLKLLESHSLRDARSTVVFGLFALMAAFLQDQGPTTLSLALLGGLLAIGCLARLAQLESPDAGQAAPPRAEVKPLLRGAARLLAVSLPLAMVGFFLFPRLAQPLWGLPQNSEAGRTGLSENMSPGDISALFLDDSPLLRVTFDGPIPPSNERYFRGPVLSAFDGRNWTRGFFANFEAPTVEALGEPIGHTVEQEPTDRRYLFALDLPERPSAEARFDHGRAMLVERPLARLTRTRFDSVTRYRMEAQLPRTLQRGLSELPPGFNPRAVALGRQWRAEHGSAEAVIQQALRWFNAEFIYTLEPPLLGRDSVDDFLFETRAGYCEHFSSAFAVLMRAAGFPARVVTGYQGGTWNPLGNYLIVRQSDAHAWTEVWIEGRGWVRIDPTNAVSPERIEQGAQSLRDESAWSEAGAPLRLAIDWLRRGWNDWVLGYGASQQQRLLRPFGVEQADWRSLGIALAVGAGVALGLTVFLLLRRPAQGEDPVDRAWRRLRSRIHRAGYTLSPHWPPRRIAECVEGAPELSALCVRYSDWAYAPPARRGESSSLIRALKSAQVPKASSR